MPEQPTPQDVFASYLRDLQAQYGQPTDKELARRAGWSRSTVYELLHGRRLPTWEQVRALLHACADGDAAGLETQFRQRWLAARKEMDAHKHGLATATAPPVEAVGEAFERAHTATTMVPATYYRDNPEFYRAGAQRVVSARAEVRLTYVRQYPPTVFTTPASAEYFAAILGWARRRDGSQRTVRRIIGVPHRDDGPDSAMVAWLREHHEQTVEIFNYEAAVMPWYTAGDGINMALFDNETAFLAFSGGGRQKLNGFSIDGSAFVEYFITHFDQLWATLEPVETYLRGIGQV
ncbi:helix-turn-helix domain-containing protein [Actinokineospora globicatena]|uniref:Helix-turn-helix domain-containing protein n=1 Tax=Actinokineospora globicatena TaxID=103729 RepID=A0A9W6QIS4_9PSEU|nr:helix-turn-helix transcriptional regulator [Actinokineospora globicatena]GLW90237.1 hypothetical protein Aglo03_10530 [Actinokineospora globicatena]